MTRDTRRDQPEPASVLQFRISLLDISPEIWRRIVVPQSYTFWDLHVAIQDAMGWLDYHLHQFESDALSLGGVRIGIPDEEIEDTTFLPGWKLSIDAFFKRPGDMMTYSYDFGDDWRHCVLLEAILPAESSVAYPVCIAGERACPPEDCGGVFGYEHLLEALANPRHKEHKRMTGWLKRHAKPYYPYDAAKFDPNLVRFDDPAKRWKTAFEDQD
jgi:hypothetical protein